MGRLELEGYFSAVVARTNTPKDKRHDALWLDFLDKIKYIANNPKYKEINLHISSVTSVF